MWSDIFVSYCKAQGKHTMAVQEAYESILCKNDSINRRLSQNDIGLVADWMQSNKFGKWTSAAREKFFVFSQPIQKIADAIHHFAVENGRIGSSDLLMDLVDGHDVRNEIFYQMPPEVILIACQALQDVGKAQLVMAPAVDDIGVKFFNM